MESKERNQEQPKNKKVIAEKDFTFKHDKKVYVIKKGDEIKVPKMFLANLKTEKVIKTRS